jgi:hypothetical protein
MAAMEGSRKTSLHKQAGCKTANLLKLHNADFLLSLGRSCKRFVQGHGVRVRRNEKLTLSLMVDAERDINLEISLCVWPGFIRIAIW